MTALRVLWLSPWLRTLSRVHAEALAERGHEILLVTSDQHPASGGALPYELVLDPRPKTPATWSQLRPARRQVRRFAPDVVVTELVRDPRWMTFAPGVPRVSVVHDDRPHDPAEQRPRWERELFDRWGRRAAGTVAFSRYVAASIGRPASVVALTTDVPEQLVAAPAAARDRRDVVVFGRLNPYKNLAVTFEAWRAHTAGPAWRGDELVLIGAGDLDAALPPHARRIAGSFAYADVLPVLHRAKASLVHYRRATQSGVQVVSMQLGVTPVVSSTGGLPEYQPAGERPLAPDDVAGLTAALDALADPDAAHERGMRARAHFAEHLAPAVVAEQWERVLRAAGAR